MANQEIVRWNREPDQRFVTELNEETRRGWDRNYLRSDRIMASSWHGDPPGFQARSQQLQAQLVLFGNRISDRKNSNRISQKRERQGLEQGQDNTKTTPGQHQDNTRTDPRTCPEVVLSPRLSPGQHSGQCPASPLCVHERVVLVYLMRCAVHVFHTLSVHSVSTPARIVILHNSKYSTFF